MRSRTAWWMLILTVGFLTNLIWENVQVDFYTGYPYSLSHFLLCLIASVVDALVILLFYLAFALVHRNFFWMQHPHQSSLWWLILLGGVVAVGFEKWALANGKWNYQATMPLIPFLGVGVWPFLQLMILPALTYFLSNLIFQWILTTRSPKKNTGNGKTFNQK